LGWGPSPLKFGGGLFFYFEPFGSIPHY